MANENYNRNTKDDNNLLFLAGLGAIAYLFLKEDKKEEDDTIVKDGGITREELLSILQAQQNTGNTLTEADIRRIVESYSQTYNSNAQQQDRTTAPTLTAEELQKYLEDFQDKMTEELAREFDDYSIDKKVQDEQEEEKQMLIDTYGEEYVSDYDMRDKAKEELEYIYKNLYNMRFPLVKDTYYDIYNFADSDTIIRRLADTQRNVIDVMRFRLNEAFPLVITEERKGEYSVYNIAFAVDMINPTSSPVTLDFIPYHIKIDKVNFYPCSTSIWNKEGKTGITSTTKEIYENLGYNIEDKESFNNYLLQLGGAITPLWAGIDEQALKNWTDFYFDNYVKTRINEKNVSPYFVQGWFFSDTAHSDLYEKRFVKGAEIEVDAHVKDTVNLISRDVVLKGNYSERPVLADRDKGYLETIIFQ